jgi:hypothetical protein
MVGTRTILLPDARRPSAKLCISATVLIIFIVVIPQKSPIAKDEGLAVKTT